MVWFKHRFIIKFLMHPHGPGFIEINDVYRHYNRNHTEFQIYFQPVPVK